MIVNNRHSPVTVEKPPLSSGSARWSGRTSARWRRMAVVLMLTTQLCGQAGDAAVAEPVVTGGVLYTAPIRFELRIGAWLPQTRSNQKAKNSADDRVNFHNLDVTPDNAFPEADASITLLHLHRLRVEYWDSTSSGRTFLSRNITFDGTVFPASSNVESTLEASALKLAYELMLIVSPGLRLGVGGGAQIFSAKSQIKLTSTAIKATRHDDRTIWFLSGDLAIDLAFLELFGTVDALSYDTAALFDGRAGAALNIELPPGNPVAAFGGGVDWRVWDTRIDDSHVDSEWTIQGLELFIFARF